MSVPATALSVRGVSRRFPGGVEALRDVSLEVAPGELVAVVGASGCGKTTLLRIIGGLDRADSGEVRFGGAEGGGGNDAVTRGAGIGGAPGASAVRRPVDIGFAFQDARLLPWRSALANVALPLELAGMARVERRRRAEEALSLVRLSGRERSLPATLSGGMRTRVALARALVTKPRLLLLDEPFSALDEVTRLELDEELLRLRRETGVTILLVTHTISEAVLLADRIVVLARAPGRVRETIVVDLPPAGAPRRAAPGFAPLAARIFDLIAERAEHERRELGGGPPARKASERESGDGGRSS